VFFHFPGIFWPGGGGQKKKKKKKKKKKITS